MAATTARRRLATGSAASAINRGAALMALAPPGSSATRCCSWSATSPTASWSWASGPAEVNVGKDQIQQFSPSLYHYISHLHVAVSGFIAAAGFAVLMLALKGVRAGHIWAWVTAVATPVLALAVALPAHYPWNLDTLGHLGLIYLAVVVFVAGAALSGKGLLDTKRTGTRP